MAATCRNMVYLPLVPLFLGAMLKNSGIDFLLSPHTPDPAHNYFDNYHFPIFVQNVM